MTTRRDVLVAGLANSLAGGPARGLARGLASGLTAGLAGSAPLALAQSASSWPEGPVKIVVPFAAGNAADVLTRLVAEKLAARLGQPFVVENKVGAGGLLGMEAVRTSKPDGHTIVSATIGTLAINQFLFKKMPHDPEADFACASLIWENCNVFVVQPQHPAKTLQELIAWSRAKPKGANIGTSALGSSPYLASVLFRTRTGIPGQEIPFPSGSQSLTALIGGDTDFAIDNIASCLPLLRAGRVRALAVTADYRWPVLPDVPTTTEAGVPDFVLTSWGALAVPKATPAAIVEKLSAAVQAVAADPATQQRFMDAGAKFVTSSPARTTAFAASERAKWKEAVQVSGAKLD